jgi:hypothetical protein
VKYQLIKICLNCSRIIGLVEELFEAKRANERAKETKSLIRDKNYYLTSMTQRVIEYENPAEKKLCTNIFQLDTSFGKGTKSTKDFKVRNGTPKRTQTSIKSRQSHHHSREVLGYSESNEGRNTTQEQNDQNSKQKFGCLHKLKTLERNAKLFLGLRLPVSLMTGRPPEKTPVEEKLTRDMKVIRENLLVHPNIAKTIAFTVFSLIGTKAQNMTDYATESTEDGLLMAFYNQIKEYLKQEEDRSVEEKSSALDNSPPQLKLLIPNKSAENSISSSESHSIIRNEQKSRTAIPTEKLDVLKRDLERSHRSSINMHMFIEQMEKKDKRMDLFGIGHVVNTVDIFERLSGSSNEVQRAPFQNMFKMAMGKLKEKVLSFSSREPYDSQIERLNKYTRWLLLMSIAHVEPILAKHSRIEYNYHRLKLK